MLSISIIASIVQVLEFSAFAFSVASIVVPSGRRVLVHWVRKSVVLNRVDLWLLWQSSHHKSRTQLVAVPSVDHSSVQRWVVDADILANCPNVTGLGNVTAKTIW